MSHGDYERELVRALTDVGLPAVRAPSSGSATDRTLPDIIAGRCVTIRPGFTVSDPWAIELKTTSKTTAYADKNEVENLATFAGRFGATPLLGARFKRSGQRSEFVLVQPDDCRITHSGKYGIPESDAADRAFATVRPPTENADAEVVR